jgi:hypothetical protein
MRTRRLTELVISLVVLTIVIQYIVEMIRPWIPYIIGACVLLLIGWFIYTWLKRI